MTKEEYLAIASAKYDELQALNKIDNFYDYEKEFEKFLKELGQTLFEKTIETTRTLPPLKSEEVLYAEVDGSMIFTRDDEWKEVKVSRVFKSSDCIDPNGKASWIRHSQYLAYLDNSQSFTKKVDDLIE